MADRRRSFRKGGAPSLPYRCSPRIGSGFRRIEPSGNRPVRFFIYPRPAAPIPLRINRDTVKRHWGNTRLNLPLKERFARFISLLTPFRPIYSRLQDIREACRDSGSLWNSLTGPAGRSLFSLNSHRCRGEIATHYPALTRISQRVSQNSKYLIINHLEAVKSVIS